jgi:hypothetical protein
MNGLGVMRGRGDLDGEEKADRERCCNAPDGRTIQPSYTRTSVSPNRFAQASRLSGLKFFLRVVWVRFISKALA